MDTISALTRGRQTSSPLAVTTAIGRLSCVRVANTFLARCIGLLDRNEMGRDEGLLLAPGGSVHTLGMRFAIDIVFLDAWLTIMEVRNNVEPWRFVLAPPCTRYVLELAANRSQELGFLAGRAIELTV